MVANDGDGAAVVVGGLSMIAAGFADHAEAVVAVMDIGEARESMPAAYAGEPLEIGFNAAYLQDGIESVEGDELKLRLINPLRPGLVQGPDEGFRYLIMPIRLPD